MTSATETVWPVGSVKGRLARARVLLGSRLSRRGVTAGAGALALEGLASAAATDAQVNAVALAAGVTTALASVLAWLLVTGARRLDLPARYPVLSEVAAAWRRVRAGSQPGLVPCAP